MIAFPVNGRPGRKSTDVWFDVGGILSPFGFPLSMLEFAASVESPQIPKQQSLRLTV